MVLKDSKMMFNICHICTCMLLFKEVELTGVLERNILIDMITPAKDFSNDYNPDILLSNQTSEKFVTQKRISKVSIVSGEHLEESLIIANMVWKLLEDHLTGCHFILLTTNAFMPITSNILRLSTSAFQPTVLVDISTLQDDPGSDNLLTALWGEPNTVCRAVMVDLTSGDNIEMIRFLDVFGISRWPEAWVVIIGPSSDSRPILYHEVFRNTFQPIYMGLPYATLNALNHPKKVQQLQQKDSSLFTSSGITGKTASVYSRCLYCNEGDPHVRFLFQWPFGENLPGKLDPFPDQHLNTQGHKFRVVSMPSFPYNDLRLDSDEVATTVTLRDSLDKRMLLTISNHLNFTYETRAPWDLNWGTGTPSGNFTGLVGTIQYNKADFITTIAPTPDRNTIIDTTRAYTSDVLSIVSLQPQLLPQYLVITRPFTVNVWMYLVLTIVLWGCVLWLLQRIWYGSKSLSLSRAIFYSWAVMLEDPPSTTPSNLSGQVMLGFWLLSCLVISTGFRSSLVAHLAVQSRTKPIDNFQDLVAQGDYEWGMEARFLTGVSKIYFTTTTDPVVKFVYKHLEHVQNHQEAFAKTIKGKYAIVCWEKLSHTLIDSYYTDDIGNTPYYVSKQGYGIVPYFGWGYGKGAPFRNRFNIIMNRLNEAGIIEHWTNDVMASRVKENRREIKEAQEQQDSATTSTNSFQSQQQKAESDTITLRMVHLTGVFITFTLGFSLALITLLTEISVKTFL